MGCKKKTMDCLFPNFGLCHSDSDFGRCPSGEDREMKWLENYASTTSRTGKKLMSIIRGPQLHVQGVYDGYNRTPIADEFHSASTHLQHLWSTDRLQVQHSPRPMAAKPLLDTDDDVETRISQLDPWVVSNAF